MSDGPPPGTHERSPTINSRRRRNGPPGFWQIISGDSGPGPIGSHGGIAGGIERPRHKPEPADASARGRSRAERFVPVMLVALVLLLAALVVVAIVLAG